MQPFCGQSHWWRALRTWTEMEDRSCGLETTRPCLVLSISQIGKTLRCLRNLMGVCWIHEASSVDNPGECNAREDRDDHILYRLTTVFPTTVHSNKIPVEDKLIYKSYIKFLIAIRNTQNENATCSM